MNKARVICRALDQLSEWCGRIFSWLIVPLTGLTLFEVVTRRFLGHPTIWTFEIAKFLYAAHFMLVISYALLYKSHVSVDILFVRLSPKAQAIISLITYVLFLFLFSAIIIWKGTIFAATSWEIKETSWSVFHPPLYPIKTVIPITGFLLALGGLSDFIKNVMFLAGRGKI